MLRNDKQVALHDLLEALEAAAGRYADDAEVLGESELGALCHSLELQRQRLAGLMAAELRRDGDLPSEPDADRETLSRLGNRLRTLLAADEQQRVVRERLAGEAELERLAQQAAGLASEPAWQTLLEQIQQDAAQAQQRLRQFAPRG